MRSRVMALAIALAALGGGCGRPAGPNAIPVTAPAPSTPPLPETSPDAPLAVPDPAVPAPLVLTPAETIPGFPDYPSATVVNYSANGSHSSKIELRTTDDFERVRAFYERAVRRGWKVVKVEEEADRAEWKLAVGTSTAELKLERMDSGGAKIRIERKNR